MKNKKLQTLCIEEIKNKDEFSQSHVSPLYATSAFSYNDINDSIEVFNGEKDGFVYGRFGNPTVSKVEEKLSNILGRNMDKEIYTFLTASGMSAITGLLSSILKEGDTVLTHKAIFMVAPQNYYPKFMLKKELIPLLLI